MFPKAVDVAVRALSTDELIVEGDTLARSSVAAGSTTMFSCRTAIRHMTVVESSGPRGSRGGFRSRFDREFD